MPLLRTGFLSAAARRVCPSTPTRPAMTWNPAPTCTTSPTFRRLAHRLRERCARETGWLGGTFPGDDAALTALAAEPDGAGWRWQTWHLYPAAPAARSSTPPAGGAHEPQPPVRWWPLGWPSPPCVAWYSEYRCSTRISRSYIAATISEYSHDAGGKRYVCTGSPDAGGRHARRLSAPRGARRQRRHPVSALRRRHRVGRPRRHASRAASASKTWPPATATARSSSSAPASTPDLPAGARAAAPAARAGPNDT